MNRVNLVLEHFLMGLFIGLNYYTLKGTSESKTRRKMTLEDLFLSILHSNNLHQPLIVILLRTHIPSTQERKRCYLIAVLGFAIQMWSPWQITVFLVLEILQTLVFHIIPVTRKQQVATRCDKSQLPSHISLFLNTSKVSTHLCCSTQEIMSSCWRSPQDLSLPWPMVLCGLQLRDVLNCFVFC